MATKKRTSGPTQPEAQRAAKQVLIRLPPEVAAELRRRGLTHPRGASGVVAGLLEESEGPSEPPKKTPATQDR